ncbi:3-oxoacyl-[acyl-carrier-protein] synthase III C-terminal domain-containing protein [Marinobacter sp. GN3S48]|uniref:3-oxoacyl-[acyl-carrier-protein] synthase III C-terminal domain-containing protein n=1 Tax=Marinobacter sp. GN3S48 TaxID=3382302 RepID=UPI00387ADFF6
MSKTSTVGIKAYGAFIPRLRLDRAAIANAHSWAFPSMRGKGEKAICSWDEDAITLGVEAARDCLGSHQDEIGKVTFASTTAPFADLQNSGIIAAALSFDHRIGCQDTGGSTRAGLACLIDSLVNPAEKDQLLIASDRRRAQPASPAEMRYGSGAAAVLVGHDDLIASFLGGAHLTTPFMDHYRMSGHPYDYYGEERWIRDEGVVKLVPTSIKTLLERAEIDTAAVKYFGLSGAPKGSDKIVARKLGIDPANLLPDFQENVGDTGTAYPMLQLSAAFEEASPGDIIVIAAFGAGCDVAVFRKESGSRKPEKGLAGTLADRIPESSYLKMLSFDGELNVDWGPRAEVDTKASFPQQYRAAEQILSFTGGKCHACGTVQFPSTTNCVECSAPDTQKPFHLANDKAEVATYSADWLQYCPAPPLYIGLVQFNSGARVLMEIVDVGEQELDVGTPLRMVFRVKAKDNLRNYSRYFWKATPTNG